MVKKKMNNDLVSWNSKRLFLILCICNEREQCDNPTDFGSISILKS